MIETWLIFIFARNSFCKQVFFYNDEFLDNELTLIFCPYDLIDVHINKDIRTFFTKFDENIYLSINAINSKGKIALYGPYKSSNKIAGVHFHDRKYILQFTNYGNYFTNISMMFSVDNIPDKNISANYWVYPIFHLDLYHSGPGKPIIYDFNRDTGGIVVIACALAILILLLITNCIFSCCNCCSCCNQSI